MALSEGLNERRRGRVMLHSYDSGPVLRFLTERTRPPPDSEGSQIISGD